MIYLEKTCLKNLYNYKNLFITWQIEIVNKKNL